MKLTLKLTLTTMFLVLVGCGGGSSGKQCDLAAGSVACGTQTCTADQACARYQFGMAPAPDMGPQSYPYCMTIPSACQCDRTCACLEANGGIKKACEQPGGLNGSGTCSDSTGELRCIGL